MHAVHATCGYRHSECLKRCCMSQSTPVKTTASPTGLDGRIVQSNFRKNGIAIRLGMKCLEYLQQIRRPYESGQIQYV